MTKQEPAGNAIQRQAAEMTRFLHSVCELDPNADNRPRKRAQIDRLYDEIVTTLSSECLECWDRAHGVDRIKAA